MTVGHFLSNTVKKSELDTCVCRLSGPSTFLSVAPSPTLPWHVPSCS